MINRDFIGETSALLNCELKIRKTKGETEAEYTTVKFDYLKASEFPYRSLATEICDCEAIRHGLGRKEALSGSFLARIDDGTETRYYEGLAEKVMNVSFKINGKESFFAFGDRRFWVNSEEREGYEDLDALIDGLRNMFRIAFDKVFIVDGEKLCSEISKSFTLDLLNIFDFRDNKFSYDEFRRLEKELGSHPDLYKIVGNVEWGDNIVTIKYDDGKVLEMTDFDFLGHDYRIDDVWEIEEEKYAGTKKYFTYW